MRFLGRRVYVGAVFVLLCALRHGVTRARWATLTAAFGVHARTLARWRVWWRETFVASEVWTRVCGRLLPAPDAATLPASWLDGLGALPEAERLQWILAWLRPLTTTSPGTGAGILMGV